MNAPLLNIVDGLRHLGLDVVVEDTALTRSFAPGVWLDVGRLHVCPWAAKPGDVLHEAGHLALVPTSFHRYIRPGTVESSELLDAVTEYVQSVEAFEKGPDHWVMRALMQMGECEAQAWSFAAAVELGFSTKDVFCYRYEGVPDDWQPYGGDGEDLWSGLEVGQHFGIHGMQAAGMCRVREWPRMLKWVQD